MMEIMIVMIIVIIMLTITIRVITIIIIIMIIMIFLTVTTIEKLLSEMRINWRRGIKYTSLYHTMIIFIRIMEIKLIFLIDDLNHDNKSDNNNKKAHCKELNCLYFYGYWIIILFSYLHIFISLLIISIILSYT